jgi:hypothetical protein
LLRVDRDAGEVNLAQLLVAVSLELVSCVVWKVLKRTSPRVDDHS